jgi:hypothetical protein
MLSEVGESMDPAFRLMTARDLPHMGAVNNRIADEVWPPFMLHDPVAGEFWNYLYSEWPDYQFALLKGDSVVAIGNSVPVFWDHSFADLPESGWDWILPKALGDLNSNRKANLQVALQIMIPAEYQGRGLSAHAVRAMKGIGLERGYSNLVVPVRPTQKCRFPRESMEEYLCRRDENGLPFDPWLRVHVRLGGKVINICHRSMEIRGKLNDWCKWTGIMFQEDGGHVVPGALVPVDVDVQNGLATYVEPNVWLLHSISL